MASLTGRGYEQLQGECMSVDAMTEYLFLWNTLRDFQLNDQPDKTIWRWTQDGTYSVKSAYNMLHAGSTPLLGHKLIWKTWAPLRIKIFLWLAFKRRHWTWDRRTRHGLEARELCYLCDQGQETIDHIIAACPFSREVWFYVLRVLDQQLPHAVATTISW